MFISDRFHPNKSVVLRIHLTITCHLYMFVRWTTHKINEQNTLKSLGDRTKPLGFLHPSGIPLWSAFCEKNIRLEVRIFHESVGTCYEKNRFTGMPGMHCSRSSPDFSFFDIRWFLWLNNRCFSGWWFGAFFIFPFIGNSNPNWLIFFRGVAQPPTSSASWITNFLLFKPSDCWWTHLFFLLFLAFWAMIKEAPRYWFKQQKITFFWWIYYFYWWNHRFSYLFVSEITMSVAKHRLFSLQKISAISSRRKRTWTGPLWCLWSLARPLHWVHFFIFPRDRLLGQS